MNTLLFLVTLLLGLANLFLSGFVLTLGYYYIALGLFVLGMFSIVSSVQDVLKKVVK